LVFVAKVLIGDAAHLALPFTSSGTTNAITDASVLVQCLQSMPSHRACNNDFNEAFEKFHETRACEVRKHIELGRTLKQSFLHPSDNCDKIVLPLSPIAKVAKSTNQFYEKP
jgi:2-polyprenyl-6-methoxyphenol hydroxylase-like FAD-dependent oxidoreductase